MINFTPEAKRKVTAELSLEDRTRLLKPNSLVEVLTEEEKWVIRGKVEVANNKWQTLRCYIKNKLETGPYMDKLILKLQRDLVIVAQFEKYEIIHEVQLYDILAANGKL